LPAAVASTPGNAIKTCCATVGDSGLLEGAATAEEVPPGVRELRRFDTPRLRVTPPPDVPLPAGVSDNGDKEPWASAVAECEEARASGTGAIPAAPETAPPPLCPACAVTNCTTPRRCGAAASVSMDNGASSAKFCPMLTAERAAKRGDCAADAPGLRRPLLRSNRPLEEAEAKLGCIEGEGGC